jgi:hypothetical protein
MEQVVIFLAVTLGVLGCLGLIATVFLILAGSDDIGRRY